MLALYILAYESGRIAELVKHTYRPYQYFANYIKILIFWCEISENVQRNAMIL